MLMRKRLGALHHLKPAVFQRQHPEPGLAAAMFLSGPISSSTSPALIGRCDPLAESLCPAARSQQRHPVPLDQPQSSRGAPDDARRFFRHDRLDQAQRLAHQPAMVFRADDIEFGRSHEGLDLLRDLPPAPGNRLARISRACEKPGSRLPCRTSPRMLTSLSSASGIEFAHRQADRFRALLDPRFGDIETGIPLERNRVRARRDQPPADEGHIGNAGGGNGEPTGAKSNIE
jgi:hypothetical protein